MLKLKFQSKVRYYLTFDPYQPGGWCVGTAIFEDGLVEIDCRSIDSLPVNPNLPIEQVRKAAVAQFGKQFADAEWEDFEQNDDSQKNLAIT